MIDLPELDRLLAEATIPRGVVSVPADDLRCLDRGCAACGIPDPEGA